MMRSLSSAVAGLRTHQTRMDVIGNNIANVNTYGFKSSRATFSDVYYQNLSGSKAGVQGSTGGTNPTQIGYGASVATIDVLNNVTGAASTDRPLDVYLTGDGFLVSKNASGKLQYSRLGNLGFDASGNLIDGNGQLIQGFPMNPDGTPRISSDGKIVADQLQGINVDPQILEKLTGISINNSGGIIGQLEGDPTIAPVSGTPDWLNDSSLSIPTTSTYNGPVRYAVSGFCDKTAMATALGISAANITSMEMGTLALPASSGTHPYTVSIDSKGVATLHRDADPANDEPAVNLTGTLKDGKIVFKNTRGEVGMTIEVDKTQVRSLTTQTSTSTTTASVNVDDTNTTGGAGYYLYCIDNNNPSTTMKDTDNTTDLYVKGVLAGDANSTGTPLYKADGTVLTDDGTPTGNPLFAAYRTDTITTTTSTDKQPLLMEMYEQMTTTDKGGNTIKEPEEPRKYEVPSGGYPEPKTFGELSFQISSSPVNKAFNGTIGTAGPGDGELLYIGNLVLAKFLNASGLQQSGTSYFDETSNSGEAEFVMPGINGTGKLKANYLEMSNVDISKEFTDMITTQRGFQANSRIITVSDEMLQELVNLKR